MIPHVLVIQAVYTDATLSKRRLEISEHTLRPSLAYQTRKPTIHIAQHHNDPHKGERLDLLQATGCEVVPLERTEWRLYGEDYHLPEGRKVVSRCDDDDVLAVDFCERTYSAGVAQPGETALIWPHGMTFWRGRAYAVSHRGNQFVSIVTDRDISPHAMKHHRFSREWRTVVVSEQVGWIWIRHGSAHTPTLGRYRPRPLNRIDSTRTPVNMRAIQRALEPSGKAPGSYDEQAAQRMARGPLKLSEALLREGSDKTTDHTYGEFYDALLERLQPRRVLEIGVYRGASIRAWRHVGYPVDVVGADRNSCPGIPVIRFTAPDFSPLVAALAGQQFDLIIDDGSHELSHQQAAWASCRHLLRPGGVFVVEDLQTQEAVDAFRDDGWAIEDWRKQSGRWDDAIAWRELSTDG